MLDETTKEFILALAARVCCSPKHLAAQPDDALLHAVYYMGKEKELLRYDWEELLHRLNQVMAKRSRDAQ